MALYYFENQQNDFSHIKPVSEIMRNMQNDEKYCEIHRKASVFISTKKVKRYENSATFLNPASKTFLFLFFHEKHSRPPVAQKLIFSIFKQNKEGCPFQVR
ncbi:hypothetical protein EDM56_21715 [Brevibacillus fluminis]|uniref:Uncharacterized protein n=1 Tax=Brevibacillus fluminis TaxID=511487 RepID=A0A3M8DAT5_9BACL|nr:hypothetical protein EDM56_21715 [Brevibacillus fluminis]